MSTQIPEPFTASWTIEGQSLQLAQAILQELAHYEVADLDEALVPLLAAASSELGVDLGLSPRPRPDRPAVVSIRIITNVARVNPSAGGACSIELLGELMARRQQR